MKPTPNFWLFVFCVVSIGVPVLIAALSNYGCTIFIYEPELFQGYQPNERHAEIRKAYREPICHYAWEIVPGTSEYVVGSGPVRPVIRGRDWEVKRLKKKYGL